MNISLKTQNLPLIGLYIIFNIAIFLTLLNTGNIDIQGIQAYYEKLNLKDGLFFSVLVLLIIILSGMVSNKVKEVVVFWKFENRLPGCRAFSQYAKEDSRIDLKELKSKFGKIPISHSKQNKYWYKIFKTLNNKSIDNTHKDFLLCRELVVITIEMFLLIIPIFWYYSFVIGISYFGFLIFEYLIVRYCAKNTAERLVVNTLALASSKI
jgi:hypothetical protein